jgi:hypothetical protein
MRESDNLPALYSLFFRSNAVGLRDITETAYHVLAKFVTSASPGVTLLHQEEKLPLLQGIVCDP